MKKLLFATIATATLGLAAPASAQFFAGADAGGVGVQVGPVGAGMGPRFSHGWDRGYYRGYNAYAYGDCRTIRQRIVTPSGRVIFKTQRVCD